MLITWKARTAAFFCYGDEGGDEMDEDGRPKILQHKDYFDPRRSHSKMKEMPMHRWFGNAGMVAWKCPIIYGYIARAVKAKNTARTSRNI